MFFLAPTLLSPTHWHNIVSNEVDFNLFTTLGSPNGAIYVICKINSGVIVKSSISTIPAFDTGSGWAIGSKLTLINDGQIIGAGGAGGGGGGGSGAVCSGGTIGEDGVDGGFALNTTLDLNVDNTNGDVFGGGGGAGGGGLARTLAAAYGGGGGGGGAGDNGGAGGAFGDGDGNGTVGTAGTTIGGSGGTGFFQDVSFHGGDGGDGGEYGVIGDVGDPGVSAFCNSAQKAGGAAGAAGNAVKLNGNSIIWLGGDNPTQVKGPVT